MFPEKNFLQKKKSKSFEEATDDAVDALRIQITKHKEKLYTKS
jgi:ribosome-associated translation inhibitor RaiA